jgi:hypothetical protein
MGEPRPTRLRTIMPKRPGSVNRSRLRARADRSALAADDTIATAERFS